MNVPLNPESPGLGPDSISKATSELNNLLQIISGTSVLMENSTQDKEETEKYRTMLRTSIERAEKVAADLAQQAGCTNQKSAVHPNLAGLGESGSAARSGATKSSILLVDDEQMALTLMKRILTGAGYDVTTAQSGFECLDAFRRRPHFFDLVLLDLTMPFMDGEDTFNRLFEIRADVPVLMCTGFIQQDRLNRLMASGLAGFMRKPISPSELVALVRSTLATLKYSTNKVSRDFMSAAL